MALSRRWLFRFLFSPRGRISRAGFWGYHLTVLALAIFFTILAVSTYDPYDVEVGLHVATRHILLGFVFSYSMIAFVLIAALCSLVVTAKRFHDRDRSGWWSLIAFAPVIGQAWILVECGCLKGTPGPNRFGPDPLVGESESLGSVFE